MDFLKGGERPVTVCRRQAVIRGLGRYMSAAGYQDIYAGEDDRPAVYTCSEKYKSIGAAFHRYIKCLIFPSFPICKSNRLLIFPSVEFLPIQSEPFIPPPETSHIRTSTKRCQQILITLPRPHSALAPVLLL